ncbi:MAG: AraC family transcriptional regulator [Flavobacteriaceae bacterium]
MKQSLYVFLLFLLSFSLLAQNAAQEIKQLSELETKTNKTEEDIREMLEISKEIYALEPDFVLDFLKRTKPLIEEKNYHSAWVDYCYLVQHVYKMKGKLKKAEKIITEIYEQNVEEFTSEEEVSIKSYLAVIAYNLGDIERSQVIIEEILPKTQTDYRKAALYYQRSINYQNSGDYKKAIKDALQAVELYETMDSWENVAVTYDLLGIINFGIKDYKKALFYAKKGLEEAKTSHNYEGEMGISFNIGLYYQNLKEADSALHYYNLSRNLMEKYGNIQALAQNLLAVGDLYSEDLHNYTEAEKYLKKSRDIFYDSQVQFGVCYSWISLGANYWRAKKYTQAKQAYDSATVYSQKLKIPSMEEKIQSGYYQLYKAQGNYKRALEHYEKAYEIKQDLNLEESQKAITELQAKYDIAVKDREIERINNENMKYRFRNRILFVTVIFVVLGTASLIYFLVYRNKSLINLYERNVELARSFPSDPEIVSEVQQENDHSPLKKVFDQLVKVMEKEKIYIDPSLTVDSVTQKLQTNKKYLSNSIAVYTKDNFNNFINSYRIREARRMILQNPSLSLNQVMYACGFNSRTPFYTAFQKNTGMSPQQFKDLSKSKGQLKV